MDPISQGVVGAVAASGLARKADVRLAALTGWTGGMLADADVFIQSTVDPLLQIEYHRHFTHALVFVPAGGLICAALWWILLRRRIPFRHLLIFTTAAYATSGLLDACTSYGTQLFWPFADTRVAWNIISIIDPLFTGPLLLLFAVGVVRRQLRCFHLAAAWALAYLLLGWIQNTRASQVQSGLMAERGHDDQADMATVKPSIGNLVLWRSIYRYEGEFYVDAVRVGRPGSRRIYPGRSVPALSATELKEGLPAGSTLAHDIDRFGHFSSGYLAPHPDETAVVGDLRYALLPDSVMPLWGIQFDRDQPEQHAQYENFRVIRDGDQARLWAMIRGSE